MIQRINEMKQREGGFTLIELLVVIVILGILSAVVVFAVGGINDRGEASAYEMDARTLRTAEEAFFGKFGSYGTMAQLAGIDPAPDGQRYKFLGEQSTYHGISVSADGKSYTLTCDASKPGCGSQAKTIALGGTLVVHLGASAPAVDLNPAITSEGGLHTRSEDMFNGLLRYELDGSVGGDLAQTFNFNNGVPAASNPNCAGVTCDPMTTVATFVLREGVKFHNGDTLTPADVEFSFSKAILAAHGRTRAINVPLGVTGSGLSTVVPPNAIQTLPPSAGNGGTVIFNFRQVFAPLKYTLNVTEAPIISEAAYGPCWDNGTLFTAGSACPANVNPVGTGPFKFQSLNSSEVVTVKNEHYFRVDAFGNRLPYLDRLVKKVVTGSAAAALQSGAVDVAGIGNADRPTLAADSRFELVSTPRGSGGGNCITSIAFNLTKRQAGTATVAATTAPTSDPASPYYGQNKPGSNENARPHRILGDARIREAIFKSLDRNQFWTDIAFGAGRVADAPVHSIFQPGGAYQGPQPLPTFDRAAANTLLDAAGWNGARATVNGQSNIRTALNHPNENHSDADLVVADGDPLTLEYLAATGNETFADLVKSHLATVGISVTTITGNNTSVVAPRIFHARTFDMGQISYCNNDEPQFGVRRQYHTDQLIQTNAFTNASGYKSTLMDQLWLDASKAPDTATYQAKFLQIQRMALGLSSPGGPALSSVETDQRIPMVQMLESAGTRAYKAKCKGFNHNNTGLYVEAANCIA